MENIPSQFWWLSIILNIAILPLGTWFFSSYLPKKEERLEKKFTLDLEERKKQWEADQADRLDKREYNQEIENAAISIAKETIDWSRVELSNQQKAFEGAIREINLLKLESTKDFMKLTNAVQQYREATISLAGEITRLSDVIERK